MIRFIAAMAVANVAISPAAADEPRSIARAVDLGDGEGAVRLSVRSQVQLGSTLHLWFVREGGNPTNDAEVLKFERKQGVPMAGTNTIDSLPKVYRVKVGRYRLLAHGVNCDGVPPENSVCVHSIGSRSWQQPTGRYRAPSPMFEVKARSLTDAGEYILEFPAGTQIGQRLSIQESLARLMTTSIRWRPIASAIPSSLSSLPIGPEVTVPEHYRSNLRCETKPKGTKGMILYYPFDC